MSIGTWISQHLSNQDAHLASVVKERDDLRAAIAKHGADNVELSQAAGEIPTMPAKLDEVKGVPSAPGLKGDEIDPNSYPLKSESGKAAIQPADKDFEVKGEEVVKK